VTACRSCVVLPDVGRFGKRLLPHRTVDVGGIAGEYELVVVSLGGERFGRTQRAARVRRRSQSFRNWPPNSRRIAHSSGNRKQGRSFPNGPANEIDPDSPAAQGHSAGA
jgi:hypothetical protein